MFTFRARFLGQPFTNIFLSCSRSALKKYILANNKNVSPGATFDAQFNRAVKSGVEKEEFAQPKGRSFSPLNVLHNSLHHDVSGTLLMAAFRHCPRALVFTLSMLSSSCRVFAHMTKGQLRLTFALRPIWHREAREACCGQKTRCRRRQEASC